MHISTVYILQMLRIGKHCYYDQLESHVLTFDYHIYNFYNWPWAILKVKVKIVHISTADILEIVNDMDDKYNYCHQM